MFSDHIALRRGRSYPLSLPSSLRLILFRSLICIKSPGGGINELKFNRREKGHEFGGIGVENSRSPPPIYRPMLGQNAYFRNFPLKGHFYFRIESARLIN